MASLHDTLELEEQVDARRVTRGAKPEVKTVFTLTGTNDHDEAMQFVLDNPPPVVDGLLLNKVEMADTRDDWTRYFTVTYAIDAIPTPGNPFAARGTTRGGKAKIFRSLETIGTYYAPGHTPRNYYGGIEVDPKTNKVNGTDVIGKNLEFSWDIYIPQALFTTNYLRLLYANTPSINSATWCKKLFSPAECLFMGADWDFTHDPKSAEDELVKLSFYFAGSINETIVFPGNINSGNPVPKPGWHHLWLTWKDTRGPSNSCWTLPQEVRVERLYKWFDFRNLGLGL